MSARFLTAFDGWRRRFGESGAEGGVTGSTTSEDGAGADLEALVHVLEKLLDGMTRFLIADVAVDGGVFEADNADLDAVAEWLLAAVNATAARVSGTDEVIVDCVRLLDAPTR